MILFRALDVLITMAVLLLVGAVLSGLCRSFEGAMWIVLRWILVVAILRALFGGRRRL